MGRRLSLVCSEGAAYDGMVRKQRVVAGAWLASAGAPMCASLALGEPVMAGLVAVFGVILPARYWDGLKPGMPGFHLKPRSADTVSWVQDRPQDYIPTDSEAPPPRRN